MHSETVAAIMLTADRQRFVDRAVEMFLQQDYPRKVLIVVDDGKTEAILPKHECIVGLRLGKKASIGAKRNVACAIAWAPIICHWDDDDIYSPSRISDQVKHMKTTGADVVAYDSMEFRDEGTGERWRYTGRPVGVSLMYRRSYWLEHPFADRMICEDGIFAAGAESEHRIATAPCEGQIIATIHVGNTSRRDLAKKEWVRL